MHQLLIHLETINAGCKYFRDAYNFYLINSKCVKLFYIFGLAYILYVLFNVPVVADLV